VTHAMNARGVFLAWFFVATTAVDMSRNDVVIRVLGRHTCVTTQAGVGLVGGNAEPGFINKQPDRFSRVIRFPERFVRMAFQAGAIWVLLGGARGEGQEGEPGTRNEGPPSAANNA